MYKYIKNKQDIKFEEFFQGLGGTLVISLDTEASSLDPFVAEWILLQVKLMDTIYLFDCRTLDKKFLTYIIDILNSSGKRILAHNAKYDMKIVFQGTGILLEKLHDTMITESLIYRGIGKTFYSLVDLVEKYTGEQISKDVRTSFEDMVGDISQEQLVYSALDVEHLEFIYNAQMSLIQERRMERVYDLEMNLIPAIVSMELNGIYLDGQMWLELKDIAVLGEQEALKNLLHKIGNKIDFSGFRDGAELADFFFVPVRTKKSRAALELITDTSNIKDWLLENINLRSHKQLKGILARTYKFKLDSTDEKTLRDLNDKEIVPSILDYRMYGKKISTYGEDFLKYINSVTGRVHSEFIQNGTVTGRFSSNNPNLQNIPADKEYRMPFRATAGRKLMTLDYSQQEYRIAGSVTGDEVIINAYKLGKDMHTATASIIFGKSLDEVTKEERSLGKTINFAVLYGSTATGLSYNLKISQEVAEGFLDKFSSGYRRLSIFKSLVEEEVWNRKYSTTLLGRRRYWEDKQFFSDYKEASKYESRVKREGFNHVIQGTGADVTKLAMLKIFRENPFGDKFKMVLQVHDEIVMEVDEDIVKDAEEFARNCMVNVFQPFLGEIPAEVGSTVGDCWSK